MSTVKVKSVKDKKSTKRSILKSITNLPNMNFPPQGVKPMLATLTDKPFNNEDWIFEIKWDGYRALSYINNGKVNLLSRNLLTFNNYGIVNNELKKIKYNCVLDGEVVAMDENGISQFQLLQNFNRKKERAELKYYVFDILWLEGKNLMDMPLVDRKALLKNILPDSDIVMYSEHYFNDGKKIFKEAKKLGLEGLMGKKANSTYIPEQRTNDWLKIKTEMRQEVIICGFTEPRGSRKFFGALILGVYIKGKLTYAGHTGTGFNFSGLKSIYNLFQKYLTDRSPFEERIKTNQPVTWLKPKLVCEIKFSNWTGDGHMRHPVFLGIREDKDPKEVKKEKVKYI